MSQRGGEVGEGGEERGKRGRNDSVSKEINEDNVTVKEAVVWIQ